MHPYLCERENDENALKARNLSKLKTVVAIMQRPRFCTLESASWNHDPKNKIIKASN